VQFKYRNQDSGGEAVLTVGESGFDRMFFVRDRANKFLTIAWNKGRKQRAIIDEVEQDLPSNAILPMMVNQSFRFARPEDIVAWQFNREFYCIVDHDREVSCAGFLFYGSSGNLIVRPDNFETRKLQLLLEVFKDEFQSSDRIQGEMIRILLVRLIIILTRIAKRQYLDRIPIDDNRFEIIRLFNLLVENHFKREHRVSYYASQLNRSPKTLANYFALLSHPSPSQLIQERIILEAKRLIFYTKMSDKEITYELGFDDPAHFSRFFKNRTGLSPTVFRESANK